MVGRNVQAQCGLTERLIEAGHELANHTMTHPHLAQLAREEEIREEILGLTRLLRQIGWNQDFFFRPPFANMDERVWEILKQHDMLSVTSRHVVGDYRSDLRAEEIYQRQVADLQSGDILLYHCLHSATVTMLPRLLDYLLAHNYDILTLTSLLERGEIPNA